MFESVLQPLEELEKWWEKPDPWDYENNLSDLNRRAMLDSVLPKKQYKRVLDIGCGDGYITARLPGEEIIGVDVSKKAIQQAEKKNKDLPHIKFSALSLFDLP
ncbi:MAG: methyltransferase domain-containing protein, partial [Calditrichaeota bacterium]|nr:methyltransferase domain-containing protein [Calditrichota bacterium]